jgi:ABC-2 type transport system permease protein
MRSAASFIIRFSAFVSKELVEILRQTRLLLALVLGPFLILLLFGLGFRNEARALRTVFVVPVEQKQVAAQVQEYATSLGPQLDYRGAVSNEGQAMADLARGSVDAVVIVPGDAEQKIRNSKQAEVRLYHREIDPYQVSYVQYVAQIYVDELNRRVLKNIAEQGQKEAADVQGELAQAKTRAHDMRVALEQGNAVEAQRQRSQMNKSLDLISLGLGASLGVLQGVENTTGPNQGGAEDGAAAEILSTLDEISSSNQELENIPENQQGGYSAEIERVSKIEKDLDRLDGQLRDFRQIDSQVLVSPFQAKAINVNNLELNSSDFFAPGVIVLLLQHLLVTFAALSIVRERISGTMELFRVSPVSAFETLLGKYISYLLIGVMLAAGISLLVVQVLRVPMLGRWENYAIVLLALMFTALGMGFIISLLSETTSQAVQYSMLILLFSIFFSGFFLDLRLMWDKIRFLAWTIPATYGMRLLQEIMFRANPINPLTLAGLLGLGLAFFLLSWLLLNRQMRQR